MKTAFAKLTTETANFRCREQDCERKRGRATQRYLQVGCGAVVERFMTWRRVETDILQCKPRVKKKK